jgi:hypothetical protein
VFFLITDLIHELVHEFDHGSEVTLVLDRPQLDGGVRLKLAPRRRTTA